MNELGYRIQDELEKCIEEKRVNEKVEKMISNLKQLYRKTDRDERGNNLVSDQVEYLKRNESPVLLNRKKGKYYLNYDWPSGGGFDGIPSETQLHKGDIIDRIGDEEGKYVCPVEDGYVFDCSERSIPYFLLETQIKEEPAYHCYEVVEDFERLPEMVNDSGDINVKLEYLKGSSMDSGLGMTAKERLENPVHGKANWIGKIARGFGKRGGGTQIKLPLPIGMLLDLDMIREIK